MQFLPTVILFNIQDSIFKRTLFCNFNQSRYSVFDGLMTSSTGAAQGLGTNLLLQFPFKTKSKVLLLETSRRQWFIFSISYVPR